MFQCVLFFLVGVIALALIAGFDRPKVMQWELEWEAANGNMDWIFSRCAHFRNGLSPQQLALQMWPS